MSRSISAQSRVEEYIRAESRLSSVDKPKPYENETKASYGWRLIRQSVRLAVNLVKKADVRDMVIIHGIQHGRKLTHPNPIEEMVVNKKTKVCSSNSVQVYMVCSFPYVYVGTYDNSKLGYFISLLLCCDQECQVQLKMAF